MAPSRPVIAGTREIVQFFCSGHTDPEVDATLLLIPGMEVSWKATQIEVVPWVCGLDCRLWNVLSLVE